MDSRPTDRRVRRTRQLLRNALLELIQEKGYEDDLMLAGFEDIRSALAAEWDAAQHGSSGQ